MSIEAANMAKKYYPKLWGIERLDALKAADKLTQEEYDALVAGSYENVAKAEHTDPAALEQSAV